MSPEQEEKKGRQISGVSEKHPAGFHLQPYRTTEGNETGIMLQFAELEWDRLFTSFLLAQCTCGIQNDRFFSNITK